MEEHLVWLSITAAAALGLVSALLVGLDGRRREARLMAANMETIRSLMSVIDAVSPFTRGHSYRVSRLALRIADEMKLPGGCRPDLEYAALLHDIGRTAINRDVLLKTGRLDTREKALVRTHPEVGHDILKRIPGLSNAASIVRAHHEQPDGCGYPARLSKDIPIESRIISVAAAFDALTVDRPYRRGMSVDEGVAEINRNSGTQFFPDVVLALTRLHESGRLHDSLEMEQLEAYTNQWCNSRLVEELVQKGQGSATPGLQLIDAPPSLEAALGRSTPPEDEAADSRSA